MNPELPPDDTASPLPVMTGLEIYAKHLDTVTVEETLRWPVYDVLI